MQPFRAVSSLDWKHPDGGLSVFITSVFITYVVFFSLFIFVEFFVPSTVSNTQQVTHTITH